MAIKILVVEDNKKNRILIRDILKYHGFEVLEAQDGEEGIRAAKEHKPALILLDIQMPVMDGIEALKILRKDPEMKGVKIIALTSFAMRGDKERFMKTGFDDYITKPIDTREFPEIIKKHLGIKEQ